MNRIETFLQRLARYLEPTFCAPRCTNADIIAALATRGVTATVRNDDPRKGTASPDGTYVTFEFEGWTIYITEEIHATNADGITIFCPGI